MNKRLRKYFPLSSRFEFKSCTIKLLSLGRGSFPRSTSRSLITALRTLSYVIYILWYGNTNFSFKPTWLFRSGRTRGIFRSTRKGLFTMLTPTQCLHETNNAFWLILGDKNVLNIWELFTFMCNMQIYKKRWRCFITSGRVGGGEKTPDKVKSTNRFADPVFNQYSHTAVKEGSKFDNTQGSL